MDVLAQTLPLLARQEVERRHTDNPFFLVSERGVAMVVFPVLSTAGRKKGETGEPFLLRGFPQDRESSRRGRITSATCPIGLNDASGATGPSFELSRFKLSRSGSSKSVPPA